MLRRLLPEYGIDGLGLRRSPTINTILVVPWYGYSIIYPLTLF